MTRTFQFTQVHEIHNCHRSLLNRNEMRISTWTRQLHLQQDRSVTIGFSFARKLSIRLRVKHNFYYHEAEKLHSIVCSLSVKLFRDEISVGWVQLFLRIEWIRSEQNTEHKKSVNDPSYSRISIGLSRFYFDCSHLCSNAILTSAMNIS